MENAQRVSALRPAPAAPADGGSKPLSSQSERACVPGVQAEGLP
uniref:Uncharacterized protein n=1 Tax=Anguilla anguilla TaxID=7936 RepID=A0A0E9T9X0_ANGAN